MSSFAQYAQPHPNSAFDKGVRLMGYAAIIYVIYKAIGLIFFLGVMIWLYSLPKDHPKKKAMLEKNDKIGGTPDEEEEDTTTEELSNFSF